MAGQCHRPENLTAFHGCSRELRNVPNNEDCLEMERFGLGPDTQTVSRALGKNHKLM